MAMKIGTRRLVGVIMALAILLAPVAWAAEGGNDNPASDIGIGVASFLCSVPYGAAKVSMAVLGGIIGGFTYLLSGFDRRAADSVWYTTIEGDYVVTPDHLRGKRDLRFTGVPPDSNRNDGR
jgi:hypothetical protein